MTAPWIDATHPLSPDTAAYPGDVPFSCDWPARVERGDAFNLSTLRGSPHVGTHVDAPLHVLPDGPPVGALPLEAFHGMAVVVRVPDGTPFVEARHVAGVDVAGKRVLFKTRARTDPRRWDPGYTALSPDAARALVEAGARLVGVDAPSVDPFDADLAAHRVLARAGMPILENLRLDDVDAGAYEFTALPPRYAGAEAAPVRAILRLL